jgi:hypothetical protein
VKALRTYILTEREKAISLEFLETGKKLEGFYLLHHHALERIEALEDDLNLIKEVLAKIDG